MKYFLMLLLFAEPLAGQTLSVIHKKRLWPDSRGKIHITEVGIEFEEANQKNSRTWAYQDIQHFDRISGKEFVILSY